MSIRKMAVVPRTSRDVKLSEISHLQWFISDEWRLPMLKVDARVIAWHEWGKNGSGQVCHDYTDQDMLFHNYRPIDIEIIATPSLF